MQDWEADGPEEAGAVMVDTFPADDPPARFKQRLKALGKRRKRYTGYQRSALRLWAIGVLSAGALLTVVGLGVAFAGRSPSGGRTGLMAASFAGLALSLVVGGALWALHVQRQNATAVSLDFHERGGVYTGTEHIHVFTWAAVGQVVFAPDSTPGAISELILSLAPQQAWQSSKGWKASVQALPNALVLTSECYPLTDLYTVARHLHAILGHLRVEAHSRDGRLYRLD